MELQIWPSDFGLPSTDVKCLQFLACAKMCASPVSVVTCKSPWNSPNGEYPVLIDRGETGDPDDLRKITDFDKFVDVLRKSGQDVVIDKDLTVSERAQVDAFACFLQQHLYPAVLHTLWVDDLNYSTITHHWYASRLHFPYSMYYIEKRRNRASRFLSGKNVNQMMLDAFKALNMLAAKLGDNKYMCGNKPSSLDALVFGYLAPILRIPLPNDRLQVHLSACPNLVRFVESIISIYLPLTDYQIKQHRADRQMWHARLTKAHKQKAAAQEQKQPEEQEDLPIRDTILFALGALTLSLLFAVHTGIIEIQVEDDEPTPLET